MATRKIIVKTGKSRRKGTVSRSAIRKAVQAVFGNSGTAESTQAAKITGVKKAKSGILQAQ